MKRRVFAFCLSSFIMVLASHGLAWAQTGCRDSSDYTPSEKTGAFRTGKYSNLFSDLLGRNGAEVAERIEGAFNQLFFGNDSTQRLFYTDHGDTTTAYIEDIANADVRTEGMSYGMMIAVQMDRRDVFDKLWKWAKTHMQFSSGPHEGYFAWHCRADGTIIDSASASDGEEWFAMSLFFASGRWGDGSGIFNYSKEAKAILNMMLHKEDSAGHGNLTNMFDKTRHLVVFVPTVHASGFTDPSYQLPHFYRLWSMWVDEDSEFWKESASESRSLLKKSANPETGLCPDYCGFDGSPVDSWGGGHADFRFDVWRVAMNVAIDHEWFAEDKWEVDECNRLLAFFGGQGLYGNQYTIGGEKLGSDHSAGLVAMNAVAALASTNADRQSFVEELWNTPVPIGHYRYYDGMLYMLGLLQVSGNFRIYPPAGK